MADDSTSFTRPDWRDPEQYGHLLKLDRAGWAWEWLRRHDSYEGADGDEPAPAQDQVLVPPVIAVPAKELAAVSRWGLCFCRATKLPCDAGATALGRPVRCLCPPGDSDTQLAAGCRYIRSRAILVIGHHCCSPRRGRACCLVRWILPRPDRCHLRHTA